MKTTIGTSRAVRTNPRSEAEPVRSRTANASATGTSMSPKTEIACAENRSRNSRSRSESKESGSRARTEGRLEVAREGSVSGFRGQTPIASLRDGFHNRRGSASRCSGSDPDCPSAGEGGPQGLELRWRADQAGLAVSVAGSARQEVHVEVRDRVPVDLVVHLRRAQVARDRL